MEQLNQIRIIRCQIILLPKVFIIMKWLIAHSFAEGEYTMKKLADSLTGIRFVLASLIVLAVWTFNPETGVLLNSLVRVPV